MAIENIWIIDSQSGICIYDWYLDYATKTIDEQLVSGLLIAFKNFSSEAGLVDISAIEGLDKKLAYKTDDRFIISGICHSKDYEPLINKTLLDLLAEFRNKYKDILAEGTTTDISPFRTFDKNIEEALEGRSAARNALSAIVGIIIAIAVAGVTFAGYFFFVNSNFIRNSVSVDVALFLGLILLMVGMMAAGIFGGIIAGDRKLGMITGIISVLPVIILLVVFFQGDWSSAEDIFPKVVFGLLYFILFGAMATLGGLLGGYLKESKYFFPHSEPLVKEESENQNEETY